MGPESKPPDRGSGNSHEQWVSMAEEVEATSRGASSFGSDERLGAGQDTDKLRTDQNVESIDANCKALFGRSRDQLAYEFQNLGLIGDYKRWGIKDEDREMHQQILRAAANDEISARLPDELNPDGTIHCMTVVLKNGQVLSEERVYSPAEPTLCSDKIRSYIADGVISEAEKADVMKVYDVLVGRELAGDIDYNELRENAGKVKEKILRYYNGVYERELFSDDGKDADGLFHEVDGDGTPIVRFAGADFKMLVHVRDAMESSTGQRSSTDLLTENPVQEWTMPREGEDYIPYGLSTSLISNEKINVYKNSEIIFAFGGSALQDDSIVMMSEEDIGSSTNAHSRYGIRGSHGNERMMMPDELIEKTGAPHTLTGFNEVVLNRFAGDKLIMPSGIVVFGQDASAITGLQRQYAKSFNVPVYLIDGTKYGGVHSLDG